MNSELYYERVLSCEITHARSCVLVARSLARLLVFVCLSRPSRMSIALLLTASSEAFVHTLPLRTSLGAGASLRHRMAIDPETMAAVSVYDSGMEAKVASLTAELESVKAELKTKSEEVEKFVDQVETQIKDSGKELEAARAKISTLSNELKEREEEVAMINTHLEAHTATSIRLRSELEAAKAEAEAAKKELAGMKASNSPERKPYDTPDPAEAFTGLMEDESELEMFAKAIQASKEAVAKKKAETSE